MNNNRASLFMPFDSLKGYNEIIKKQEKTAAPKRILCEDELEILDRKIHEVRIDMNIRITYWNQDMYVSESGKVTNISLDMKWIEIDQRRLDLKNIVDIQSDDFEMPYE